MKKCILVINILLGVSSAWATLISDDFNRADTGMGGNGNVVGADWENSRSTLAQWGISGNQVVANLGSTAASTVLYNTALETVSGNGTNFTASLDVAASGAYWGGIAFNYQNPTNFYYFRYKGANSNYQMYRYVDGASQSMLNSTISGTFATDTAYTLTVTSSDAYVFGYEIKDGGTTLVSGTATDANSNFTGGYAGIIQNTTGPDRFTFDNFSLEVIPEPATIGMFGFALVAILVSRRLQL